MLLGEAHCAGALGPVVIAPGVADVMTVSPTVDVVAEDVVAEDVGAEDVGAEDVVAEDVVVALVVELKVCPQMTGSRSD